MSAAREDLGYIAPEQVEPSTPPTLTNMQRRVLGRIAAGRFVGRDCASLFALDDLRRLDLIAPKADRSGPCLTRAGQDALAHARKRKP